MSYKSSARTLMKVRDSQTDIIKLKNETSSISTKIDAAEKSISDEIWKDTIINIVDDKGNIIDTKSMETILVKNTVSLDGLKSEVKDVKTYVGEKNPNEEDSLTLTEKITSISQNADGIELRVDSVLVGMDEKIAESEHSIIEQVADKISTTVENEITGEGSYVNQKADAIENVIGKKLFEPIKVRYIRDWLSSNNIDDENRFLSCKVFDEKGINVAANIRPTAYNNSLDEIKDIDNLSSYTDENIEVDYIYHKDCSVLQIDLGIVYKTINTIQVWHYFADNRIYDSKLEISEDGMNWVSIYDSSLHGQYEESPLGHEMDIQIKSVSDQISILKQSIDSFQITIKENNKNYSTIIADQTQILQQVNAVKEDIESKAAQIIDANGWKLYMQKTLGLSTSTEEDINKIETCIQMSPDEGITITSSEKEGYKTSLTPDELAGYYNDGTQEGAGDKVFSVKGDLTYAKRFQAKTGVDFITMKEIPVAYTDASGKIHNMISFIKGGGNS